jgi:hypothetical protein
MTALRAPNCPAQPEQTVRVVTALWGPKIAERLTSTTLRRRAEIMTVERRSNNLMSAERFGWHSLAATFVGIRVKVICSFDLHRNVCAHVGGADICREFARFGAEDKGWVSLNVGNLVLETECPNNTAAFAIANYAAQAVSQDSVFVGGSMEPAAELRRWLRSHLESLASV